MRIVLFAFLMMLGAVSAATGKEIKDDLTSKMEKAEKIERYKLKKDLAWHKTEYNKVIKYLNKSKK
jgi:hypothetical protein